MPKLKTHTGAKKRFKLTKTGKIKRAHAYKSHLLNNAGKTSKRKRGLSHQQSPVDLSARKQTALLKSHFQQTLTSPLHLP